MCVCVRVLCERESIVCERERVLCVGVDERYVYTLCERGRE